MGAPSEKILASEPKSQTTETAATSLPPWTNFYTGKSDSVNTAILTDDVCLAVELWVPESLPLSHMWHSLLQRQRSNQIQDKPSAGKSTASFFLETCKLVVSLLLFDFCKLHLCQMLSQATLRQLYIWPPKDMLNNVHSSFICNSPKLETSQMSVSRTDKQTGIVHTIRYYMAIRDTNWWYTQQCGWILKALC